MQDAGIVERLVLDGKLTIRTIESVYATVCEAFGRHQALAIDCTGAEDVDLTFIQLLVAARTSASQADKSLALAGPPEGVLLDALNRAGFGTITRREMLGTGQEGYWFEGANA